MENLKTTARYQVDAEKVDGGLIRGYLVIDGGTAYIYGNSGKFEIKHDTIKPVAAEYTKIENPNDCAVCRCPNCGFGFAESTKNEYCPCCGQRISWSN